MPEKYIRYAKVSSKLCEIYKSNIEESDNLEDCLLVSILIKLNEIETQNNQIINSINSLQRTIEAIDEYNFNYRDKCSKCIFFYFF